MNFKRWSVSGKVLIQNFSFALKDDLIKTKNMFKLYKIRLKQVPYKFKLKKKNKI
jgi:hypothetical protein